MNEQPNLLDRLGTFYLQALVHYFLSVRKTQWSADYGKYRYQERLLGVSGGTINQYFEVAHAELAE